MCKVTVQPHSELMRFTSIRQEIEIMEKVIRAQTLREYVVLQAPHY